MRVRVEGKPSWGKYAYLELEVDPESCRVLYVDVGGELLASDPEALEELLESKRGSTVAELAEELARVEGAATSRQLLELLAEAVSRAAPACLEGMWRVRGAERNGVM